MSIAHTVGEPLASAVSYPKQVVGIDNWYRRGYGLSAQQSEEVQLMSAADSAIEN